MTDRHELLEKLRSGRDEFLASVDGVTEEQAAAKPAAGWSILECAEHVAIVEENLRRLTVDHPLIGKSSGQEILILMIAHPFRHALQVKEGRVPLST